MSKQNIYTLGGTVQAGNGIYIPRQADEKLLALCRDRKFAYILTSRQMGKSSLMVRTAERLIDEEIQSVVIDLAQIGTQVTAEQWYLGILAIIEGALMLDTDVVRWWQEHTHLGFTQRLTLFFQLVLLTEITSSVVIFVDEIDTTLSLSFTDDFFMAIRYFYTARTNLPDFHRLSFVLIGVATPSDLIRDPKRTPFNIGQRIDLTDFTFEEAKLLAEGLELPIDKRQEVLRWVLEWTGGHPYLTQHLCYIISQQDNKNWSKADVENLVSSIFFGAMIEQNSNLQFVRDMLTKRAPEKESVLTIYKEILQAKHPVCDDEQSIIKSHLKLSGVVSIKNAKFQVRNPIYKKAFNPRWVQENLPVPFQKLPAQAVVFASLAVATLTISIRFFGVLQPLELSAYDHLMQMRPIEEPDNRLLVVTISENDIREDRTRDVENPAHGSSISEKSLNLLLEKLQQYQPSVIGLDIYRNFSAEIPQLRTRLQQTKNLIAICKSSEDLSNSLGIQPPPEIPRERLGFSDLIVDQDGTVRRQLLLMSQETKSPCATEYSFSLQLALKYFNYQGINLERIFKGEILKIDQTTFERLKTGSSSGYQVSNLNGYQVLLNWRANDKIAQTVSLTQILKGEINPNAFKNKIVLIGVTAPEFGAGFTTPYTNKGQMPSLLIQAHMTSQLLSAILDKRPLIWVWPIWADFLWIWNWSLLGGILMWRLRQPKHLGIIGGVIFISLYIICLLFFFSGGWIPFIPSALAFAATSGSVAASQITIKKNQRLKITKSLLNKLETTCSLRNENMTDVVARLITEYIEQNKLPINTNESEKRKN
jgi:CHASE2 domain-containing sensor protein